MISVRFALYEDSQDIFHWRNDPLTRRVSRHSQSIQWQAHKEWFALTLENVNRYLLICCDEKGDKIAVIRFDVEGNVAEISINLNPNKRGMGLAKPCLSEAIDFMRRLLMKAHILKAEIKMDNIVSQVLFESIGFEYQCENENVCCYQLPLG